MFQSKKIKIALLGTFSSGKSSFINSLLNEEICDTGISVTTKVRTDFIYGLKPSIINAKTKEKFDVDEFKEKSLEKDFIENSNNSHFIYETPIQIFYNTVIIDTPGIDITDIPDCTDRTKIIDEIIHSSINDADIFFYFIGISSGCVRVDDINFLKILNEQNKKIYIVINKCDLKTENVRELVLSTIKEDCSEANIEIERFLLHTSRKPKENGEFYEKCQNNIRKIILEFQGYTNKQPSDFDNWLATLESEILHLPDSVLEHIPYTIEDRIKKLWDLSKKEPDPRASIKIAMVGTFSSGKSSFLNSLLDKDLAAVSINQATRCQTNFTYGDEFQITDMHTGKTYSENEYKELSKTAQVKQESYYTVAIPDKRLEGIVLMDSPGFDPPKGDDTDAIKQDVEISKQAAKEADVCFFLIDKGTIGQDSLEYLHELNERTKNGHPNPIKIYIILNKADLKLESARNDIIAEIKKVCNDKTNPINVEDFLIHTSRKPKKEKNIPFYEKCQQNIWQLLKKLQEEKIEILTHKHSIWDNDKDRYISNLFDDILEFIDFQLDALSSEMEATERNVERKKNDQLNSIIKIIKENVISSASNHLWGFASDYRIEGSGIFFDDWRAYIRDVNEVDRVLPTESDNERMRKNIETSLESIGICSWEYSMDDILDLIKKYTEYAFINRVNHGLTKRCDYEEDADKVCRRWQREWLDILKENIHGYASDKIEDIFSFCFFNIESERFIKTSEIMNTTTTLVNIQKILRGENPLNDEDNDDDE